MTDREALIEISRICALQLNAVATEPADPCPDLVARIYLEELHRGPDAGGLEYWTGRCRTGTTEAEIRAAFRAVDEHGVAPAPSPSDEPVVAGMVMGELLEGGNPKHVQVPNECAAVWPCDLRENDGLFTIASAGNSTDGTPPAVWVWLADAPNGNRLTGAVQIGGQTTVEEVHVDAPALRKRGFTRVYYHEQPVGAPGQSFNRYAQTFAR